MDQQTLEHAKALDAQDPLRHMRDEFYVPEGKIYMDGNSLGLLSKRAETALLDMLSSWKTYAIDGWTEGAQPWFYLSETLGSKMAALAGAKENEVIATGSTTVNLHQLAATFYKPSGSRTKILADELNFPSDIYALQSQIRLHGLNPDEQLIRVASDDGLQLDEQRIIEHMTDEVALIVLPSVLYRSGQILDMEKLSKAAAERNIPIGFDLCHSIGSIPHDLHNIGADFAFWCTYKHLNGGPGSVGGLYVHEKHFGKDIGLAGWFGSAKDKQFDMEHTMTAAEDAGAFQIGTPHVLSCAPLIGSLEIFNEAGIERVREKSLKLTEYMHGLIHDRLSEFSFVSGGPSDERRGGHLLIVHEEAARICKALKECGVIPDFRAPDGIRLAPVALYNSFEDVWETVRILKEVMEQETYKKFSNERGVVA